MSVTWSDFNGQQYEPNGAGERMDKVVNDSRRWKWLHDMPDVPDWTKQGVPETEDKCFPYYGKFLVRPDVTLSDSQMDRFLQANYHHLLNCGKSEVVAKTCSILRLCAVTAGAVGHDWKLSAPGRQLYYNEVEVLSASDEMLLSTIPDTKTPLATTTTSSSSTSSTSSASSVSRIPRAKLVYTSDDLKRIKAYYPDLICSVAHAFRGRGHHWLSGMDSIYNASWKACQRSDIPLPITWEEIATTGLHAVFPDVLDVCWAAHCVKNECSGGIKVRFISVASGTASLSNMAKNARDLLSSGLALTQEVRQQIKYVLTREQQIVLNRWDGSINYPLYGAKPVDFDETLCGALAASALSIITKFKPDSKMLNAKSVQRIANSSPITSAVIGTMMSTIVERLSESMANRVIADDAKSAPMVIPPMITHAGSTIGSTTPSTTSTVTITPLPPISSSPVASTTMSSAPTKAAPKAIPSKTATPAATALITDSLSVLSKTISSKTKATRTTDEVNTLRKSLNDLRTAPGVSTIQLYDIDALLDEL
jgi:hypothetical protein